MKNFTIILALFIAMTIKTNAQIPNSGFETWTPIGGYNSPNGWITSNSFSTGSFYAVTKDLSHYPSTVGNYSVRLENNIALLVNYSGLGIFMSGSQLGPPHPSFSLIGHPTSLTGYYKFAPQNGDTMYIGIRIYIGGGQISSGSFKSTATATNWTSFNIPIPSYTTADSGDIVIAAYNANGPLNVPYGNSVLYVDNLNFDNLISSTFEPTFKNSMFSLFPNPVSDVFTLNMDNTNNAELTLNI